MVIETVDSDKKRFIDLLLMGDEQESMIDRYLDRGTMFIGKIDEKAVACCVVTYEGDGIIEIKNLAVAPEFRCKGLGRAMIEYVEDRFKGSVLQVGTGETPSTLRFYRNCDFEYSHRVPDFFIRNYSHPIIEEGIRLCDMLYLVKKT